ncbi:hypothetical protein ES703_116736 [subsurface metagenome]
MEYSSLDLSVVVFGQNHLLLGIGAAYGGTVAVAARGNLSGTDARNPGYPLGMLAIGRAPYLTFVGPGGT